MNISRTFVWMQKVRLSCLLRLFQHEGQLLAKPFANFSKHLALNSRQFKQHSIGGMDLKKVSILLDEEVDEE